MKNRFVFISLCVVFPFVACRNRSGELPKSLENKKSTIEIVTKRGYDDLIESLYTELTDKDDDLKQLEKSIKDLSEQKNDSTAAFDHFNGRNHAYYHSAGNHIGALTDSLLRDRIKEVFNEHIKRYNTSVAEHQLLLDSASRNTATLADLHVLIKLFKTLPLIEQYQQNNVPDTVSLQGLLRRQNEVMRLADSILQNSR